MINLTDINNKHTIIIHQSHNFGSFSSSELVVDRNDSVDLDRDEAHEGRESRLCYCCGGILATNSSKALPMRSNAVAFRSAAAAFRSLAAAFRSAAALHEFNTFFSHFLCHTKVHASTFKHAANGDTYTQYELYGTVWISASPVP